MVDTGEQSWSILSQHHRGFPVSLSSSLTPYKTLETSSAKKNIGRKYPSCKDTWWPQRPSAPLGRDRRNVVGNVRFLSLRHDSSAYCHLPAIDGATELLLAVGFVASAWVSREGHRHCVEQHSV